MSAIKPSFLEKAVLGKLILIDTNIIIYLTDSIAPYNTLSRLLFEMVEKEEVSAIFSIISVAEVMQGPLKKGLIQNALAVKNYLMNFPNASCQPITGETLIHIGMDSRIEWSQLRMMDSLIISSGIINNVDLIVSNDMHFKKAIARDFILSFDN
jgi:predicted nucleic acid-binding protein